MKPETSRHPDISIVYHIFQEAGFDVAGAADITHPTPFTLSYRENPDGSIRWLWPLKSRHPQFLRFCNIATTKAKLLSRGLRILFRVGAGRLFAQGRMQLFATPGTMVFIQLTWGKDFAMSTGTPGPNRKAMIWHTGRNAGDEGIFTKMAFQESAFALIQKENNVLTSLRGFACPSLRFPLVLRKHLNSIHLSDVSDAYSKRSNQFTALHSKALGELQRNTLRSWRINRTSWWPRTLDILEELSTNTDERIPKGMIRKLQHLAAGISPDKVIPCALAHGNFTPWNMYVSGDHIQLYDWESPMADAPVLWDAFHFIWQAGILSNKGHSKKLLKESAGLAAYPELGADCDLPFHLQLYLLVHCTSNLEVYTRQAKWHPQVTRQLRAWSEALDEVIHDAAGEISGDRTPLTSRQMFCMDVFDYLQGERYAAVKWMAARPEDLPMRFDIDLFVENGVLPGLTRFIQRHPLVTHLRMRNRSSLRTYTIFLEGGHMLSIEAIWQFKRKDVQMLDAGLLLNSRKMDASGVQKPSPEMDFRYTSLSYFLNGTAMPEQYCRHFQQFNLSVATDVCPQASCLRHLTSQSAGIGWNGLRNKLLYYIDLCRDLLNKRGLVITFSGLESVGKSTIIEQIRVRLEKQLHRRVVVFRHRPSLLPVLSAFLIGQFYIRIRYVNRGYLVLYDRYYFDHINNSRRTNIGISSRFTRGLYRHLIKPDLNFFRFAQPEVLCKSKQEPNGDTISPSTEKYRPLFEGLSKRYSSSKYISIDNLEMHDTVSIIVEYVKSIAS